MDALNGDECMERGEHAAENAADARAGRACIAFCYQRRSYYPSLISLSHRSLQFREFFYFCHVDYFS